MKDLSKSIAYLQEALSKEKIDWQHVLYLSNQIFFHLFVDKNISEEDQCKLFNCLVHTQTYTHHKFGSSVKPSTYASDYEFNTIDYKIARELILQCKLVKYEHILQYVKHYYFDTVLVYRGIEQMIELQPLEGILYGILNTPKIYNFKPEAKIRGEYWQKMKILQPSIKEMQPFIFNTSSPLHIRKEFGLYILETELYKQASKSMYLQYFIKAILFEAKEPEDIATLEKQNKETLDYLKG